MSAFTSPSSGPVPEGLFHLSVAQYHEMIAAGILTSDDPVELLDGVLVQKMPKNPPHATAVRKAVRALDRLLPSGWCVLPEAPVTLATSEPEPDVVVARGMLDDYTTRHPAPQDILLLVEVGDATLARDKTTKLALYAAAGIPQYWLLDLHTSRLETYTDPDPATRTYRTVATFGPAEHATLTLPESSVLTVPIGALIP